MVHTSFLLLFLLGVAFSAQAKKNSISIAVKSKLTHVDTDGNGIEDLIREYDSQGKLKSFRTTLQGLQLIGEKGPGHEGFSIAKEDRTLIVFERQKIGHDFQTSSIFYNEKGEFDSKKTTFREGEHYVEEHFLYRNGTWSSQTKRILPQLFGQVPLDLEDRANSILSTYTECLENNYGIDAGECRAGIDALFRQVRRSLPFDPGTFSTPQCSRDNVLFLNNGFSIDLRTCDTPHSRQVIALATEGMMDQLSCMRYINNKLAANMFGNLLMGRPTIYCASNDAVLPMLNERMCGDRSGDSRTSCEQRIQRSRLSFGAFVGVQRHGEIYLGGEDPRENTHATPESLAGVMLHEFIHSCNHPPTAEHNHGDLADEVYGCHSICGGPAQRDYITKEGCQQCLTTDRNSPSRSLRNFCNSLPINNVMKNYKRFDKIANRIRLCTQLAHVTTLECRQIFAFANADQGSEVCPANPRGGDDLSACFQAIELIKLQYLKNLLANNTTDLRNAMGFRATQSYINVSPSGTPEVAQLRPSGVFSEESARLREEALRAICAAPQDRVVSDWNDIQSAFSGSSPLLGSSPFPGPGATLEQIHSFCQSR